MPFTEFDDWMFLQPTQILVTAATVGIHRSRWCSVPSADNVTEAHKVMRERRFDALPIDPGEHHPVVEYFVTKEWGKWDAEDNGHTLENRPMNCQWQDKT